MTRPRGRDLVSARGIALLVLACLTVAAVPVLAQESTPTETNEDVSPAPVCTTQGTTTTLLFRAVERSRSASLTRSGRDDDLSKRWAGGGTTGPDAASDVSAMHIIPRDVLYSFPPHSEEARLFLTANARYVDHKVWRPVYLDDDTCLRNFDAFGELTLEFSPSDSTSNSVTYTPADFKKLFHAFHFGAHKADLCRYHYVFARGGVMIDADALLAEPLTDIVDREQARYVGIRALFQSFSIGLKHSCMLILGATARNPILRDALRDMMRWRKDAWMWGPVNWTDKHRQFLVSDLIGMYRFYLSQVARTGEQIQLQLQEVVEAQELVYRIDAGGRRRQVKPLPKVVRRYRELISDKQYDSVEKKVRGQHCFADELRKQVAAIRRVAEWLWRTCEGVIGSVDGTPRPFSSAMRILRDCVNAIGKQLQLRTRSQTPGDPKELLLSFVSDVLVQRSVPPNVGTRTDSIVGEEGSTTSARSAAFRKELELRGYGTSLRTPVFLVAQLLVFHVLNPWTTAKMRSASSSTSTSLSSMTGPRRRAAMNNTSTLATATATSASGTGLSSPSPHDRLVGARDGPLPQGHQKERRPLAPGQWMGPLHYQNFNAKLWHLMHAHNTTQAVSYLQEDVQKVMKDEATILTQPSHPFSFTVERDEDATPGARGGEGLPTCGASEVAEQGGVKMNLTLKFDFGAATGKTDDEEVVTAQFQDVALDSVVTTENDNYSHLAAALSSPASVHGRHVHRVLSVQKYLFDDEEQVARLSEIIRARMRKNRFSGIHVGIPRVIASHHYNTKCPAYWVNDLELPKEIAFDWWWTSPEAYGVDCGASAAQQAGIPDRCGYTDGFKDLEFLEEMVRAT